MKYQKNCKAHTHTSVMRAVGAVRCLLLQVYIYRERHGVDIQERGLRRCDARDLRVTELTRVPGPSKQTYIYIVYNPL